MSNSTIIEYHGAMRAFIIENQILLTILAGLLISSIVLIVYRTKGHLGKAAILDEDNLQKNNYPTFIIAGDSNSGKTTLFQYLTHLSQAKERDADETSMKFQELDITTTKSFKLNIRNDIKLPFQSGYKTPHVLIDIPGEDKIFSSSVKNILNHFQNVKGIAFVIDATVHNNQINRIAKKLFQILFLSERRPEGIDILLIINKIEQFGARPVFKFKELLEKELDEIKNLNLKNLKKVNLGNDAAEREGEVDEVEQILEEFGNSSVRFQFTKLEGSVDVAGGSLHSNKVEGWVNWFDERAVN